MLFPTQRIADHCRSFIERRSSILGTSMNARLVHLLISPDDAQCSPKTDTSSTAVSSVDLHIVLFQPEGLVIAKEFWQHTGLGISSRLAEKCLSLLAEPVSPAVQQPISPITSRYGAKGHNKHYSTTKPQKTPSPTTSHFPAIPTGEDLDIDHSVYLEERYGRNLPLSAASFAKRALRSRVAGVLVGDNTTCSSPCTGQQDLIVGPSTRGISEVAADDVYLFPTGMAAIWNAHNISLSIRPAAKSVCFGCVRCLFSGFLK